jgi:hypothetical protein
MEEALVGFAGTEGEALNITDAKSALKRHLTYKPAFNVPKFGIRKKRSQNMYFDGNNIVTLPLPRIVRRWKRLSSALPAQKVRPSTSLMLSLP